MSLALIWLALAASADGGLAVEPPSIRLVGSDASAQVLVAAPSDGDSAGPVDRTHAVTYEVGDPTVAVVEPGGLVRPLGDGATTLTVRDGERSATISIEVEDFADRRPVGFVGQVVPILTKTGCNAGACHGKATGQNGFRLSLLGFDPKFDYDALVREGRGRRVFPAAPERSLILRKPAALIPHGGGRRFAVGSPEYRTIERWVAQGMPFDVEHEPKLVALDVQPARRVLAARDAQQLRVTARYDDGTTADVTRLAQYQSNAADLATVDETGRVQALDGVGEAAVMVRFGGQVAVARATIPRGGPRLAWAEPESSNPIDRLVFDKLRALNLPPSGPCSDAEFARRACLDLCGTLPTPEEVAAFEADTDPDKRAKYVDRLLERPEYADHFASKWSAILRNTRGQFFGEITKPTTFAFHAWVRQAIAGNMPYDRFTAAIIAAKGDPATSPAVAWYRARDLNMPNDEALIEDTAQLFLGMRLQCAKCHHHPFERWGQDDYYGFASIFSRVGRKPSDDPFAPRVFVRPAGLAKHPQKGTEYAPKALGGPEFADLGPRDDPRDRLVDWLRQPDNPFFARAYVNRTWKHFFGRGLVEPEDDLRVTNPPTNPELLDALSDEFVRSGYDMRHLIRLIATSAAYARSSLPDEQNAIDRQNFARYYPRRLPAEVLLDAINTVTGDDGDFGDQGLPRGFRAIQLPDEGFASVFLEVFGRPKRESVCECERTDEPSLAQRLHLLNSNEVERKVGNGRRARELAEAAEKDPALDAANVEALYRVAYARPPDEAERAACLAHLAKARARGNLRRGYEDLVWVVINSKEFLFNR